MKHSTKILFICTGSLLSTHSSIFCAQKIKNFFTRKKEIPSQTTVKEYPLNPSNRTGSITIVNPYGSITISKEWSQDKIALSTIATAKTVEQLPVAHIDEQKSPQGDIKLTVVCHNPDKKTAIDIELIVPEHKELKLDTTTGTIHATNIHAPVSATTTQGSINLEGIRGTVVAQAGKQGNVTIKKPASNVKASTEKGALFLYDTPESVLASSNKGPIHLTCRKLPATGKLTLQTTSGKIFVGLPDEINADLMAKSKRGAITCDHFVTIKPFTTQWNKSTLSRLKHEICGTLGSGEALITIQNDRGNIKIGKYA